MPRTTRTPSSASQNRVKPSTLRAGLLLLLAVASVALVVSRLSRHGAATGSRELAQAVSEEDLPLTAPPPPPSDDTASLRNNLQKAADARAAAAVNPQDAAGMISAGAAAYSAGDRLGALSMFQQAQRNSPSDSALKGAARSAYELGLFTNALESYRGLTKSVPNDPQGYLGMAKALIALGRRTEAKQAIASASSAVDPSNVNGRLLVMHDMEERGEIASANEEATRLLQQFPDHSTVQSESTRMLVKLLKFTEAQAALENRLKKDPSDPGSRRMLASVLLNPLNPKPDRGRAEEILLALLQEDAGAQDTFHKLGELYLYNERYPQAAFIYMKLLAVAPGSSSGRLQFARAAGHLKNSEYVRMSREQQSIGQALLAQERSDERLGAQANQDPANAIARLGLARHYAATGRNERALPEFQAAWVHSKPESAARREAERFCSQFGVALTEPRGASR